MLGRAAPPPLGIPPGLLAECFEDAGEAFVIFEWPARGDPRAGAPDRGVQCASGNFTVPRAQREILGLLLAGRSNAEIARRRRRSPRTVAHQVETIYRRFGVGSRLELFALAARGLRPEAPP